MQVTNLLSWQLDSETVNFKIFRGKGCRCGLERPATRVIGGQESMVIQMNNEYCLVNILKTLTTFYFLDAVASLGSMLESQSVQ